ncbi:MAG TPA: hypothetical protein VE964_00055 [Myxococcales bacterium]|nr:hypothetical protein [Myxococcales bacterium]
MRKLLALSCAFAAACGGSAAFKDQARDAMPDSAGVAMGPQQAQSTQSNALIAEGSSKDLIGADPWYNATVAFAASVNLGTAFTLGAVAAVTTTEPTSCTQNSCTWGPGSGALDPNEYMLVVTQNASGSFDWTLSGRSKANVSGNFVSLISGNAVPSGQRHRGSGTFTINLDNVGVLSGRSTDKGTIDITYSNLGPAHVQANFHNLISQDSQHAGDVGNAYYNFQADITGGGDMEIAWHDVTNEERDDIHSRWKADGSGRADVQVVKPGTNVQLSECWSAAASGFVTVDLSVCSYTSASFGTNINTPQ